MDKYVDWMVENSRDVNSGDVNSGDVNPRDVNSAVDISNRINPSAFCLPLLFNSQTSKFTTCQIILRAKLPMSPAVVKA